MEIDVPYSSWEGYAHSAEFATGTVMSFNARGSENKFTVAFPKRENTKPITMSWDELLGDVAWSMSTVKAVLRYPGELRETARHPMLRAVSRRVVLITKLPAAFAGPGKYCIRPRGNAAGIFMSV